MKVLLRDTNKIRAMVDFLFEKGILVIGLTFRVVRRGDETLHFQLTTAYSADDVELVLEALADVKNRLHPLRPTYASVF